MSTSNKTETFKLEEVDLWKLRYHREKLLHIKHVYEIAEKEFDAAVKEVGHKYSDGGTCEVTGPINLEMGVSERVRLKFEAENET